MSADKKPTFGGQPYRVRTVTVSIHSANLIHDERVAETYGFAGGLVAGRFCSLAPCDSLRRVGVPIARPIARPVRTRVP